MSQLSLLTGVFGREAASRVANVGLPELKGLVDKSFLHRNSAGGFRIHELLRQFVSAKLKASPTALKEAETRLREYYASRLQERVPDLQGAGQKAGLDELAPEFENVLVAWDLAVRDQEFDALSKMVEGLWLVCELRGWFNEALGAMHRATLGMRDATDVSSYLKASLLACSGRCHLRLHQLEEAERDLKRARVEAEPAERPPLYAFVLNNLGLLELQKSNPIQAQEWFEQSLKLYSSVDKVWGVANVVNNLGDALQVQGRAAEAQDHYQRSLRIFRNLTDQRGLVTVLRNLGRLRESQNEFEEARVCFEECVSAARDLKDRYMLSRSLRDLALVATKTKEWELAEELLDESQTVAETMGDPLEMAHCTFAQARLKQAQGHRDSARGLAREALRRINRFSDSPLKPKILGFLDNLNR
ncbi:MAG: tetratricopeptide repeat protein [Candidatus Eisenbacteria bacterium]|uniref:Tetratricopeptide repeat protein n=1 Tax=Eiseniibacteriota bacterium TaxID=2212470 RepID=A0A7Y2E868_UNCEI|nr:tetratricopeptide repeat protein [Candidatus Eisenbacteria bacterium]